VAYPSFGFAATAEGVPYPKLEIRENADNLLLVMTYGYMKAPAALEGKILEVGYRNDLPVSIFSHAKGHVEEVETALGLPMSMAPAQNLVLTAS
jgi:hypothetical protein